MDADECIIHRLMDADECIHGFIHIGSCFWGCLSM